MAGPAAAHPMYLRCQPLPGNKVQVHCFMGGGSPAVDAVVEVRRPDGSLLGPKGVIDEHGYYVFSYERAEDLKVRVSDGEHAKEEVIPAAKLTNAPPPPEPPEPSRLPEILAGISLILALAAFWLGLRNASRLRALQQTAVTTPARETAHPAPLPIAPGPR